MARCVRLSRALASEPTGPSIDDRSVSHKTEHDAVLEAQIDPNGAYSSYELQIVRIATTRSRSEPVLLGCPATTSAKRSS